MTTVPLILLALAVACLAGAYGLLRSLGMRYRVGRLLAVAPVVDIAEARALAAGRPKYVRVTGRITSDEEFPDENDRPLVFRRKRIDIAAAGASQADPATDAANTKWRTIADEREAVPFGVETRSDYIAVDVDALTDGLVAIPRVSDGKLGDLPADMLEGIDDLPAASAPARLVIDQLSAVEHATVCGTPVLRDGQPTMTAGLNRPLIVTILEPPEAMRLLAAGSRPRVLAAAALIAASVAFVVLTGLAVITGI